MTTIRTKLPALLLAVALSGLAACGSEDDSSDAAGGATPEPTSSSSASEAAEDTVVSVSLRRTGGLKPVPVNRVFAADAAPPAGFTDADVREVLDAAQAVVDEDVNLPDMPRQTCCDRFTYTVVIETADGTSTTYTTIDGVVVPKQFSALLSALS